MTSLLKIYKASAGSGKTYRLTIEFLKLVIENPQNYSSILAVTFTNKATAEMKNRILTELFGIAKGLKESDGLIKDICDELAEKNEKWRDRNTVIKNAQLALNLLLHDYSRFRVETIDSFFQTILRNLAKELGLGAYMNIELDSKSVLSSAVKSVMERVKDDRQLFNWIYDYMKEHITDGKSWRIDDEMESFGNNIFREDVKQQENKLRDALKDKKFLSSYRIKLNKLRNSKKEEIINAAKKFSDELEQNHLSYSDFVYGKSGVCSYFISILEKQEFAEPKKRALDALNGGEYWCSKTSGIKDTIISLANSKLIPILEQTEEIRQRNIIDINSCDLIIENLNNVGLLYDIAETTRIQNAENNRFMLADTPTLLHEMIKDSDAPFIYEKIGANIRHIMIDEFQDTSKTQWGNFKPLLAECIAQNEESLIVGDPKQSIYRFRNGDWRILGNLKNELAEIGQDEIALNKNWRSESGIIKFNNLIFRESMNYFQLEGNDLLSDMKQIYGDAEQICAKAEKKGYVEAEFISDDEEEGYEEIMLKKLVEKVETLQTQGIQPEDITILVRKNKFIPFIAEYLAKYEMKKEGISYELISDEAYRLEASLTVQIIINALRYLIDPLNEIYKMQLYLTYQTEIAKRDINELSSQLSYENDLTFKAIEDQIKKLSFLPLYELIEEIYRILELDKIEKQESYLFSFLDGVSDFLQNRSSDIKQFLGYWDDVLHQKTIPFSSDIEGMRIMSIHKSKGLEFHTVIIPFCEWNLKHERSLNPLLWCSTETEPYNELPLIPVKYGSKMPNSIFAKEYSDETVQLWVDNLNILYVALTRAEKNLIIIGKDVTKSISKKAEGDGTAESVSGLLMNILAKENEEWDSENSIYKTGNLVTEKNKAKTDSENRFKQKPEVKEFAYHSYKQKARFKQSNKSNDFIEEKEREENEYINRGKLLHYLFSNIATKEDIPTAANQLLFEGLLSGEKEKNELIAFTEKAINSEKAKNWFKPGVKLFNECEILYRDEDGLLQNRRPDRVIQEENHMTVIDFKFGKAHKSHQVQVEEYVELLKNMGYEAEGNVWYVM